MVKIAAASKLEDWLGMLGEVRDAGEALDSIRKILTVAEARGAVAVHTATVSEL
jgi:hypothetical protein